MVTVMKKYSFFFAAVSFAALAVSCSVESSDVPELTGKVILSATVEDALSKAAIDEEGLFTWSSDDKILVYAKSSDSPYVTAEFSLISGENTGNAKFAGELPEGYTVEQAIYPSSIVIGEDITTLSLPASYNYEPGKVKTPMSAELDSDAVLAFKHLCGVISVSITDVPADAAKIVLTTPGKQIAGSGLNISSVDGISQINAADSNSGNTITVEFTPGAYTSVSTLIPVPVGTYESLSVAVAKADGTVIVEKKAYVANTVARKGILAMPAFSVNDESGITDIKTGEELVDFLAATSADDTGKYRIVADLDMTGLTVTPAKGFAGTLDGRNHKIKNWTSNGVSLFAAVSGTVKNIVLDASCSLSLPKSLNAPFGFITKTLNGTVSGITNNADVSGTEVAFAAGRTAIIVGQATNPSSGGVIISDCVNNGNLTITTDANTGGTHYFGTIVGSMGGSSLNYLQDCTNNGDITMTFSGVNTMTFYLGAVAGGTTNGSNNVRLKNYGNFTFTSASEEAAICLAGISGYTTGVLTDCYNEGDISFITPGAVKATFVAGIAGYFASNTMKGSVNKGNITVSGGYILGRNGIGDIDGKKSFNGEYGLTAGFTTGGLVSATGKNPVFEDSDNYGKITVSFTDPVHEGYGTHTAARPSVGGCVGDSAGPMTNVNNHGDVSVTVGTETFTCKNAGYTMYVGGIAGAGYNFSGATSANGSDTNANNKFAQTSCTNDGNVTLLSYNAHTTNCCVAGIVGWPQTENNTGVYQATSCVNNGKISAKGNITVRVGGIHGGTGRMKGCTNNGDISVEASTSSVIGSLTGFTSQKHIIEDCNAFGTVTAVTPVRAIGGIAGLIGNAEKTTGTGCAVNCDIIGGDTTNAGAVVGVYNGNTKAISLGTEASPIKVKGSVNGTTLTSENFTDYLHGNCTTFSSEVHTIHAVFGE